MSGYAVGMTNLSHTSRAVTEPKPPTPLGENVADEWMLDPSITYLNHGCFGARPRSVVEHQQHLRNEFEADPFDVLHRRRNEQLAEARQTVSAFLGAPADDFVFVTNATAGVNAVLRSLRLQPGDELLTVNHVYNAIRMTMQYVADRAGATAREIDLPVPIGSPDQIVNTIQDNLRERTRLLIIDEVSSPTAVVFPVEAICRLCEAHGIDVLVDGAHAPGMLDVNIKRLNPAYYAGNLHKWVCAPVGAGFLYVRPDKQTDIHPPVISHFLNQGLVEEFNWQGTRDVTPWLSVPAALEYFNQYGWQRVREHNHAMAVWAQQYLAQQWDVEPVAPTDGAMLGSMVTVFAPREAARFESGEALIDALFEQHGIEVAVFDWNDQRFVRVSCQIYNTVEDYERLAKAVRELTV